MQKAEEYEKAPALANKGTGAGGSNTNKSGKTFEEKTNNESRLLEQGFTKTILKKSAKYGYYLSKTFEDKTVIFTLQSGLKLYMKSTYDIDLFRFPDEAYIIEFKDSRRAIKILEKKAQNVDGSVETKLWSGPCLKREYELVLDKKFQVYYGFCLSNYFNEKFSLSEKKYKILHTILEEHNIELLFGDDTGYFDSLDEWLVVVV